MNAFSKLLSKGTEPAYALLRIMSGLLFMSHGTQKLLGFPSEFPYPLNGMSTAAGGIEIVGGLLIALGLFTSPVAFLCSGMAAVGYWLSHGTNDFFPINNGGELIALYCFIFLFIATRGSGILSLDKTLSGR